MVKKNVSSIVTLPICLNLSSIIGCRKFNYPSSKTKITLIFDHMAFFGGSDRMPLNSIIKIREKNKK